MNANEYLALYEKYISGFCSAEEEQLLFQYKDQFKLLTEKDFSEDPEASQRSERIYGKITATLNPPISRRFNYPFLFKAAAVLALTGSLAYLGINYWSSSTPKPVQQEHLVQRKPIPAGKNTATLTLADGAVINLDQYQNGIIEAEGPATILKREDGTLVYSNTSGTKAQQEAAFNTITVPKGGKYSIALPDGTQVWLNSESAMTYPVVFSGKTRTVSLKGEAYFEVAKAKNKPFIVTAGTSKITVLGTHFNVQAYESSASVNTTLLEGSVRLSSDKQSVALIPGQQGNVDQNSSIKVSKANLTSAVAWKNGYFMFQDDHIKQIMEQISRWYNVEVSYEGDVQEKTFGGIYAMNKDLDQLLKGLELTGLVHFKVEGRRVTVMK